MHLQIVFNILLVNSISRIMIAANSPPIVNFGPSSGTVLVQENFRINGSLFKITAKDPDGQDLSFSMMNDETKSLVDLSQKTYDSSTGFWKVDVLLKAQLDRDRSPNTRTLVFSVTDGQLPLQGRVSLTIRDVNDNPPMFTKLPYRINLPENSTIDEVVFIATAEDVDDGQGRQIVYSMTEQTTTYNNTFVLENENCGNITLKRQLDYETQPYYQFQIFVKDRGSPPCPSDACPCNITEPSVNCAGEPAIFSVAVTDVQDTPPFFTGLPYLAYVHENATIGHSLFKVIAMDGDRGVPNDVTYSLAADNMYFIINNKTGEITLNSSLDADEPGGQNVILSVTATEVDTPGQLQQGATHQTTQVFISVLDVNDNAPEFTRESYTASMKNSTPRGAPLTLSGIIEVTDGDRSENSLFILSVENNGYPYPAFETVPQTGTVVYGTTTIAIRVNDSSLIGQEGKNTITFQIVARETGTLELFEARANIIVTIEDEHWWNTCDNNVETTTSAAEVTTSHGHHDITCTESRMEFSIPLSSPHTSETATLSDPNCQINVTRTHVRGGVDLNSCGTTVQFQNDSVIFRNAIIFSAPESSSLGSSGSNGSVSQYQDIIPIQCVYNRIATVHLSYMPVVRRVLFTESGVGQFSFNIQQFWDASFTNMVSDRAYPLRMELDADVFIQLSVGSEGQPVAGHKEIGMEVQQCLVSPSSSVIEAQLHYYPLIQDGCPASSDVHIIPNTNASDSTVMRFRFRAVNFFDPSSSSSSSLVFVHCRMGLCLTGSCKPSAWSCLTPPARRVRRDVDQSKRAAHQLSTGPFLIMADEASTSSSSTTATVMAVVSTSVATVAIVIAAIALIALRRRRTTERN